MFMLVVVGFIKLRDEMCVLMVLVLIGSVITRKKSQAEIIKNGGHSIAKGLHFGS